MEQNLTIWDVILTPVFLGVLIFIAKWSRNKRYPVGHPLRRYYLPGLYVKFFGAIFIALIYQFYYGGGDTFNYFYHSKIINSSLNDSFTVWVKLLFRTPVDSDPRLYKYVSQMYWYGDAPAYTVSAIGAVLGLLNGTTYIPIALLFAFISYSGIWAMYKTFVSIYPKLYKHLALAFLFIPSTFVWGSGIFKDTICMFGLGWMTYCTFRIFINRDLSIRNLFLLSLSFYLVAVIKIYILLAFMPALCLWLLLSYSHSIESQGLRYISNLLFIGIACGGFYLITKQFADELNKYSLDKIAKTAEATRGWIYYISGDEGSAYSLGDFSPTVGGMISKFPQGVMVTFFRPFPWEVKKLIMALSMLEAVVFIFLCFKILFTRAKNIKFIFKDPNLLFFFVFSLIFGFAVGITSSNFGALSRYKIPCLPFFAAMLLILIHYREKPELTTKVILPKRKSYSM